VAHTAGLEPAPPWSATRSFIQLSYVCVTGAATETRTPVYRLRTGMAWPRSGNGGAPRTRTELNLLARETRGPCACPDWSCVVGQTLVLRVQRSDGERGLTPTDRVVPTVGFEPTSPRLQRGAFTRLASQAELKVVRPTGIEPMSARWHRAALPLSYGRWCTEQDSNLRSPKAPDLQSGLVAA
jgi:hypothetical protein